MKESTAIHDNEIISLMRSTDKKQQDKAFSLLYDKYAESVNKLVKRNSGNVGEAEDVFQDTLIVLHKNLRKESFELTCKLNTYIYSIARNLWFNKLRKTSRLSNIDDAGADFIDIADSSLEVLQRAEENSVLNDLIMKLGENCQKVLKYFYFERMKLKAIANELGYANETVAKTKKSKCIKQLRDMVGKEPHIKTALWTS